MDTSEKTQVIAIKLARRPNPGFYLHYQHDPQAPIGNHTYEVLGVGVGYNGVEDGVFFVVRRPLYRAYAFNMGSLFVIESLEIFVQKIFLAETTVEQFTEVTDPVMIARLMEIRDKMYPTQAA